MDDERLRVAHVREVAPEFESVDERPARGAPAVQTEREDQSRTRRQISARQRLLARAVRPRIVDPCHLRTRTQKRRDRQGVLNVGLHAERQRFESDEQ